MILNTFLANTEGFFVGQSWAFAAPVTKTSIRTHEKPLSVYQKNIHNHWPGLNAVSESLAFAALVTLESSWIYDKLFSVCQKNIQNH